MPGKRICGAVVKEGGCSPRMQIFLVFDIEQILNSFNEIPKGEWTVKLKTITDVDRLAEYLGWGSD